MGKPITSLSPDAVAQVADLIAAATIGMDEKFAARLQELRGIKAEIDAKVKAIGGIDNATAEAERIVSQARAKAETMLEDSQRQERMVQDREDAIGAREAAVKQAQEQVDSDRSDFIGKSAEQNDMIAKARKDLDAKMAEATQKLQDAERLHESLVKREQVLNDRIQKLRAATTA